MTIDEARKFILGNSGAIMKDHPKHGKYLEAIEVVERHKNAKFNEWRSMPEGRFQPRLRRMSSD